MEIQKAEKQEKELLAKVAEAKRKAAESLEK